MHLTRAEEIVNVTFEENDNKLEGSQSGPLFKYMKTHVLPVTVSAITVDRVWYGPFHLILRKKVHFPKY